VTVPAVAGMADADIPQFDRASIRPSVPGRQAAVGRTLRRSSALAVVVRLVYNDSWPVAGWPSTPGSDRMPNSRAQSVAAAIAALLGVCLVAACGGRSPSPASSTPSAAAPASALAPRTWLPLAQSGPARTGVNETTTGHTRA
jgi:hypothetical protein